MDPGQHFSYEPPIPQRSHLRNGTLQYLQFDNCYFHAIYFLIYFKIIIIFHRHI